MSCTARRWRADVVRTISSAGASSTFAHLFELRRRAIGQLQRRQFPPSCGRLLHFLAVLVHAGDEQHIVAVETLEARDDIGGDPLIGMPDMRRAIGIGNGRRDVVGFSACVRSVWGSGGLDGLIEQGQRIDHRLAAVEV